MSFVFKKCQGGDDFSHGMSTRFTRSCPSFAFHDEERDIKNSSKFLQRCSKKCQSITRSYFFATFQKR